MKLLTLGLGVSLALWAATVGARIEPVRAPVNCDLAYECSNGKTYIGCDALQQCKDAGGN